MRLLATTCLETAHTVDPAVAANVDAALVTLLPPRSTRESRSLALAGDRVLGKLPDSLDGLSDAAAAACVRAVALINGPAALRKLAGYASDPRDRVQAELAEVWRYFDAETYANAVLASAPLQDGYIRVRRRDQIPLTHQLTHLNSLDITLDEVVGDLEFLTGAPPLFYFWCQAERPLKDLSPLLEHTELAILGLYGPGPAGNLQELETLSNLQSLCVGVSGSGIEFVEKLPKLTMIDLQQLDKVTDLAPLTNCQNLDRLGLRDYRMDPIPIALSLPSLTELILEDGPLPGGITKLHDLLPQLTLLHLAGGKVDDLSALAGAAQLNTINLDRTDITDLRPLAQLPKLRWINLCGIEPGLDLSPLAELPSRAQIILDRRQEVRGLDIVRQRHSVKRW